MKRIERELEEQGPGAVVVKTTSHRSRHRLKRLVGDPLPTEFLSMQRAGAFYVVPGVIAAACCNITGVSRSRRYDDLFAAWTE